MELVYDSPQVRMLPLRKRKANSSEKPDEEKGKKERKEKKAKKEAKKEKKGRPPKDKEILVLKA